MKLYIAAATILLLTACSKTGFLDTNPNPSLTVPSTLADFQAILDNDFTMNGEGGYGIVPALGETGADNYYLPGNIYTTVLHPLYQRAYVWDKDVFENEQIYDWNIPYQSIDRANVVLDGLKNLEIEPGMQTAFNKAEGSALFYRAHLFYQLAQIFAAPYNKDSALIWPGVPLRTSSLLTEPLTRGTLQQTYDQVLADLTTAAALLPGKPVYATQPCKAGCYGLLARTYLTMGNYDSALAYADLCLQLKNDLMNYNQLDINAYYPFGVFNAEDIFQCEMIRGPDVYPVNASYAFADTVLYSLYDSNDLRKKLFIKPGGTGHFTGSYSGAYGMFAGIATDEIYLIRAECGARKGHEQAALNDLNTLLENRYKTGSFIPYTTGGAIDALSLAIQERRKELCFRGLRWTDLRRLNATGYNIVLHRSIDGIVYELPANDRRYVYPIPGPVLNLNPSIEQNIR